MLILDINRVMDHRLIQNPQAFLIKGGFNYHTAGRLLRNQLAGIRNLEKLCIILNCTPNDLLTWSPDSNLRDPGKLALSKLSGRKSNGRLPSKVKDLSLDKLEELHQFVNKLTTSE